jgi:hypothetical protein
MTYDEDLTVDVMSSVDGGKLYIATGYMNFSARLIPFENADTRAHSCDTTLVLTLHVCARYASALIGAAAKLEKIKIITAAMSANGFMTAKGCVF